MSHWQGTINWQKVKSGGYGFAIAKATEGSSATDSQEDRRRACLLAAERRKGADGMQMGTSDMHGEAEDVDMSGKSVQDGGKAVATEEGADLDAGEWSLEHVFQTFFWNYKAPPSFSRESHHSLEHTS
mgnify:CR=1 FL=1